MSGSSLAAGLAAVLSVFPLPAPAGKKPPPAYGILSGTVFRDPGYALPDARVVLLTKSEKPKKLQEETTNFRGEFAFRVPPADATYVVRASAKGYRPEQKEVSISGEEEVPVNLVLSPENK